MEKWGTGINLRLEAQFLGYKDQERQARQRAQLRWYPYVSPFEQQLYDIRDIRAFDRNIRNLDGMLADIGDSESGELVYKTRQIISTYVEMCKIDEPSNLNLTLDYFAHMRDLQARLGSEEFERQRKEAWDWHTEMRQRVLGRFVELLGEIMTNSQVPTLVQEKAKEIQSKLIH